MRKFIAALVLVLTLFCFSAVSQTLYPPEPLGEGFYSVKSLEKDGTRTLLIIFPKEYLETKEKFKEGTMKVLPLIFTCEFFAECKPVISGVEKDEIGMEYAYVDAKGYRIMLYGVMDDDHTILGLAVRMKELKANPSTTLPPGLKIALL